VKALYVFARFSGINCWLNDLSCLRKTFKRSCARQGNTYYKSAHFCSKS